jgi:hypothetical protein
VVEVLVDTTLIPREVAPFHVLGEKSGLDRFMGTWTAEQEAEVLEAVEFLGRMDESQHDRISRFLEELEQEEGPIEPEVMEEVRKAFPSPEEGSV